MVRVRVDDRVSISVLVRLISGSRSDYLHDKIDEQRHPGVEGKGADGGHVRQGAQEETGGF